MILQRMDYLNGYKLQMLCNFNVFLTYLNEVFMSEVIKGMFMSERPWFKPSLQCEATCFEAKVQ